MEFINELNFQDVNYFIDTEDTIDIFQDDILDDLNGCDKFIGNNIKTQDSELDDDMECVKEAINKNPDQILEDAVVKFKHTRCDKAFNKIYNRYNTVIKNWSVRSTYNTNENADDVYGEVMGFVLLNAIESWEPGKSSKFNSYFWVCIKNYMFQRNKKIYAEKRKSDLNAISIHGTNGINKEGEELALEGIIVGQEDVVDKYFDLNITIDNLKTVTDRNKLILKMTMNGYTFDEISKETGITGAAAKLFLKRFGTTPEGKLFYKLLKNTI